MALPKLLVTGCNGLVGKILWNALGNEYDLYGLDRTPNEQTQKVFQADVSNPQQVREAFKRIPNLAFILHLAGDPRVSAEWDSVLANNIDGTKNIYDAARQFDVKRIVFASSNHVTGAYEGIPPSLHLSRNKTTVTIRDAIRPDSFYGVGKAAGEALARMYFELYGIESICLRIGSVIQDDDPRVEPRYECTWLSHRDLIQLVRKSLSTSVKFGIYYGVSNNAKRFWDISNAESELDYRPEDNASEIFDQK